MSCPQPDKLRLERECHFHPFLSFSSFPASLPPAVHPAMELVWFLEQQRLPTCLQAWTSALLAEPCQSSLLGALCIQMCPEIWNPFFFLTRYIPDCRSHVWEGGWGEYLLCSHYSSLQVGGNFIPKTEGPLALWCKVIAAEREREFIRLLSQTAVHPAAHLYLGQLGIEHNQQWLVWVKMEEQRETSQ